MVFDVNTTQIDQIPLLQGSKSSFPSDSDCGIHAIEINPSRTLLATGAKNTLTLRSTGFPHLILSSWGRWVVILFLLIYICLCIYYVEQKNGVKGCYRAGSCWHTVFLHSTVVLMVNIKLRHLSHQSLSCLPQGTHSDWIFGMTWIDEQFVVSGSRDGSMALWQVSDEMMEDVVSRPHSWWDQSVWQTSDQRLKVISHETR